MHFYDCLRLAAATITRQKGRTIKTLIICGLLPAIISGASFLTYGVFQVSNRAISAATAGRIIVTAEPDAYYGADASQAELATIIQHYGGSLIEDVARASTADGTYPILPATLFSPDIQALADQAPADGIPIVLPVSTAITWLQTTKTSADPAATSLPLLSSAADARLAHSALGQTITSPSGQTYFLAGLIASSVGINNITFADPIMSYYAQELVTPRAATPVLLRTAGSAANLPTEASTTPSADLPASSPSADTPTAEASTALWAYFTSATDAYRFFADPAVNCDQFDRQEQICPATFRYAATAPLGFELSFRWSYQNLFSFNTGLALVLGIFALIITFITQLRLLGHNPRSIALYYSLGASARQVHLIHLAHLILLDLLAGVCAILIGFLLALILNLINLGSLTELYTTLYGLPASTVFLIGWSWSQLLLLIFLLPTAPLCILCARRALTNKQL